MAEGPRRLFVGGVAPHTPENELYDLFRQYGEITDCLLALFVPVNTEYN